MSNLSPNDSPSSSRGTCKVARSTLVMILRSIRIVTMFAVAGYSTYELGAKLNAICGDLAPYGVKRPWYAGMLIQVTETVVVYERAFCALMLVFACTYFYAEFRLSSSRLTCILINTFELSLLLFSLALLLAWGAGLETILLQYFFLTQ